MYSKFLVTIHYKYHGPLRHIDLIGSNQIRRDILFYHPEGQSQISKLINQITESLINYAEIDAKVDLEFKSPSSRCVLIKQGNITYTRKKILPIILNASSMVDWVFEVKIYWEIK